MFFKNCINPIIIDLPKIDQFQETTLQDIINDIKPFDLICFKGNEFVSKTISIIEKASFGNGDWTHVGIIITNDILPFVKSQKNKIYIWESTISGSFGDGVNNEETNKGKFGVQIRDFTKVVNKYLNNNTKIGWCKLKNNPYIMKDNETLDEYNSRLEKIKDAIIKFYLENGKANYDYKILTLFKTILPNTKKYKFLKKIFHTKDLFFCSELVAHIYKIIGIISNDIDPEEIAPIELLGYSNNNIGKIFDNPFIFVKKKIKI
jgi:hypothetical protein